MKNETQRFREVLDHFDTAMLISHDPKGELRARPMAIARSEDDGTVWFVTGIETGKVDELEDDDRVAVVCQGDGRHLSITGQARLVVDEAKVTELWQESWRLWYPEGPSDPHVVLIEVKPRVAEFWDRHGVLKSVSFAVAAARAYLNGDRLDPDETGVEHGRVELS